MKKFEKEDEDFVSDEPMIWPIVQYEFCGRNLPLLLETIAKWIRDENNPKPYSIDIRFEPGEKGIKDGEFVARANV